MGLHALYVLSGMLGAVEVRFNSCAAQQRNARLLLLALAPMLLFAGHWPSRLDIPGTDYYLSVPFAAPGPGEEHDHGRHCHADAGSCSDVPASSGAGFAMMHEAVAAGPIGGLLLAIGLWWWRPTARLTVHPELRPPRPAGGALAS